MSEEEREARFIAELGEHFRPLPLAAERGRALRRAARESAAPAARWAGWRPALAVAPAALAAALVALALLARPTAPFSAELALWEDEVLGAGAAEADDVWAALELPEDYEELSELGLE